MTGGSFFRDAAASLILTSAASGNGGPVDMSHIAATGSLRLQDHCEVMLLSEDLAVTVERDHVSVVASYRLRNDGETVELVYGFPVERFESGEFEHKVEDITGFRISADGVPLAPGQPLLEDTLFLEIEGMIQSGRALRTWLPTELRLESGSETHLEVAYSVRPCFVDWSTTKDPFVSSSYRYFRYLLDPSGEWGDGLADEFTCTIDFRRLLENGGEVVSLPAAGEWIEPGLYGISVAGFDLASAPPLEMVYDPGVWMRSDEMNARAISSQGIGEVVSSEPLPPQGGNSYAARNLFDSDLTTTWAVPVGREEAVPWMGVATGELELSCLAIVGGYAKSVETWFDNSRVSGVRLTLFLEGRVIGEYECDLPDTGYPGELPLARAFQNVFTTGEPVAVDSLMLEVTGVYPARLYDDLCISEMLLME